MCRHDPDGATGRYLLSKKICFLTEKGEQGRQGEEQAEGRCQLVGAQADLLEAEKGVGHVEQSQRNQVGCQAEAVKEQVGHLSAEAPPQVVNAPFVGIAVPGNIGRIEGQKRQQDKDADSAPSAIPCSSLVSFSFFASSALIDSDFLGIG